MNKCSKCSSVLVRASRYDPDGLIPLHEGIREYYNDNSLKEWWVCLNATCPDGKLNTSNVL